MKRTPETLAKVIRLLFCKSCNSSADYISARLEKSKLKLLAGSKIIDSEYMVALSKSLFDNRIFIFELSKYYVFVDMPQLANAPIISRDLFNKLLPSPLQEIDFKDGSDCHWSVNHPVWQTK